MTREARWQNPQVRPPLDCGSMTAVLLEGGSGTEGLPEAREKRASLSCATPKRGCPQGEILLPLVSYLSGITNLRLNQEHL
jgi:hypothetical protein